MVGDRWGGYTDMNLSKIPFWGVIRTIGQPNPLNGWVRRKYFYLRSCFGVLGGIRSVQLNCSALCLVGYGRTLRLDTKPLKCLKFLQIPSCRNDKL